MDNLMLALTLLIAGFVVVFLVLVLLILIITIYGKIIQKAQKSSQNRKARKRQKIQQPSPVATPPVKTAAPAVPDAPTDEIPGEIIAVIAAAVDALYGEKPHRIKSVKRSRQTRSAWGNAGGVQNTGTF